MFWQRIVGVQRQKTELQLSDWDDCCMLQVLCSIIAGILHFVFLVAFAWMCLEGIQLYVMLVEVFEVERSRIRWYYAAGYGIWFYIFCCNLGVVWCFWITATFLILHCFCCKICLIIERKMSLCVCYICRHTCCNCCNIGCSLSCWIWHQQSVSS